ncbi:helix-turn-helix transcriptional regulator [Microbacterium sp. P26]|uniref:helix-turn-helix transcriptional regulator n=1 Tax=Microbacterium TaxID=33882 RepID=UPI00203DBC1C|nr:helix-turn-helix transcriptional regulator [Microbacterium sp. P26]MCM3503144.1 helix-turn-helix transcriptional regulator [Microbacterium sp. P26]
MPGTPSSVDARATFRAAALSTALRLAPGHGVPLSRHLALLAEADLPEPPPVWTDERALTVAALLAARARRDALADGTRLVRQYFDDVRLLRPTALSSGARALLYTSVGEYCAALGWAQVATRFGAEALLFADAPALRYRALSVMALGHAINGEFDAAESSREAAARLFAENGWPAAEQAYILLLAEILTSAASLDVDRLARVPRVLDEAFPDSPSASYTARAAEVMVQLLRRDFGGARAGARQLLHSSGSHESHRMVRSFVVIILSDTYVAQGDAVQALAILEPYDNPAGHGVCFSMQRSAALLQLGRERDLLRETDACMAAETDHCLRTFMPVLLGRALAWNRLGDDRRARQSVEAALLIMAQTGIWATTFSMLPRDETMRLVETVAGTRPDLAEMLPDLARTISLMAAPGDDRPARATDVPLRLTPTERDLVAQLHSSLSLAEIAQARGVSVNTVKSQVRSIYLKLGVSGRTEAVEHLSGVRV